MKICMVISTPFPPEEGIGNYSYNLCKKLLDKGHEVVIITRGPWFKFQSQVIEGIEVIRAPFIPVYPFYIKFHGLFVNKVFRSIESQIDIVHIHTPLSPLIKTQLPIVTTFHTPMLTDYRYVKVSSVFSLFSKISARFISYPLELKLIQDSELVMTVTDSVAQELKDEYHVNKEKISTVGNGVDEKFFYPKGKKSESNNKYILYVGHIDREKGLFDLVESGRYICKERSDISFYLAGKGRDYNKLRQKIRVAGLQDKFKFLGQVGKEDLVKLYQNAALFVFPSYHEGLSTVLLEAMSCGLPIITTDVRGNRDLISDGQNGILVPPRDPKRLAKAISLLLSDEQLRIKYGKNGRKIVEEKYTWSEISNKVLSCYELAF